MANKKIRSSLLVILLLLFVGPIVPAQDGTDAIQNVRTALERTDEIIQRARELIRGTNAPAPALTLEQAIGIQRQAWDNFNRSTLDGYSFAAKLTMQARELAKKALASARLSEQGNDAVQNRLQRTEELLRRAHESMQGNIDEALRTLFETARRNLMQAREFYRNGQYRPAIKLAAQVEKTAKQLIQIANRQQNFRKNFERRLNAVSDLIARIEPEVIKCKSEAARALLEQAKDALRTAHDLATKGPHDAAAHQLQQARRLASGAADLCGRPKDLNSALERLKGEAERVRDEIPRNDETAKRLMEQVFSQLENAKQFIENQDSQSAAAALRAAQLTLKQLHNYLGNEEI
jgi:HEPN domain-containing protein